MSVICSKETLFFCTFLQIEKGVFSRPNISDFILFLISKSFSSNDKDLKKFDLSPVIKIVDKKKSDLLLQSIRTKYPNHNEVLSLIGNNYRDQDQCDKAIKIYDKLIKASINKDNFYYLKAICLDKLDKWKDSKKLLLELISRNPEDAYVLNYLSYSLAIRNEDLIKAKKLIKKALEIEKNN